jgi:antitoxin MazE
MVKKLTRTGNSVALVLEKDLLAAAGIDPSAPVEVSTNGDAIIVTSVRGPRRKAKLKKIATEAHKRFGGAFRRLAE